MIILWLFLSLLLSLQDIMYYQVNVILFSILGALNIYYGWDKLYIIGLLMAFFMAMETLYFHYFKRHVTSYVDIVHLATSIAWFPVEHIGYFFMMCGVLGIICHIFFEKVPYVAVISLFCCGKYFFEKIS